MIASLLSGEMRRSSPPLLSKPRRHTVDIMSFLFLLDSRVERVSSLEVSGSLGPYTRVDNHTLGMESPPIHHGFHIWAIMY